MIAVILSDMRWRILAVLGVAVGLYFLEPAFHQHGMCVLVVHDFARFAAHPASTGSGK